MENKNKTDNDIRDVAVDEGTGIMLRLSKPYTFEGKTYEDVDLSRLNDLTIADMISVERRVRGVSLSGGASPLVEMTLNYACHLAATAANLPVEFFLGLPIVDSMTLKGIVTGFLF
nr:MAG TPA: tail assembly chaperone [Caudoviricetes sp.]